MIAVKIDATTIAIAVCVSDVVNPFNPYTTKIAIKAGGNKSESLLIIGGISFFPKANQGKALSK